ncbi:hypothetical protein UY3_07940 [Chelonia mydas]|uniref:Uncharacterized protein n=1 Tax=Chelonia mydas TaxID=8469 RepID=M7BAE9_CHEMY|nr:hypothetical protein UY3_07940 [Chelonia mydas]
MEDMKGFLAPDSEEYGITTEGQDTGLDEAWVQTSVAIPIPLQHDSKTQDIRPTLRKERRR